MERLPEASRVGTLQELKSSSADAMAVDLEELSTMEVDDENGRPKRFTPSLGKLFKKKKIAITCNGF